MKIAAAMARLPLRAGRAVALWFDNESGAPASPDDRRIDWLRVLPFIGLHLACLAPLAVGWSPIALVVAALLYTLRMFAITAFYHRYFSHRAFATSRALQFIFAVLGAMAVQRGPLWWAAHHRHHHRASDTPEDLHGPQHGFWTSHVTWFLTKGAFATRLGLVPDLARYKELRFLDRFDILVPVALAASLFGLGETLAAFAPGLGTNGWQMLVWGFVLSTVALFHATFTINSLAHRFGRRRYATRDSSKNSLLLALLTFGEGWHNNHHRYPGSVRQGFFWWELDLSYYVLRVMAALGLVWDLRPVPERVLAEAGR